MKKLLIALVAAAALAAPASALAWGGSGGGHHGHHSGARFAFFTHQSGGGDFNNGTMFAKLSATGAPSFGGATATVSGSIVGGNDHVNGHWNVSLSTNWSTPSFTKTWTDSDGDADDGTFTLTCAPSTATLTLTNGSTTTDSLTGKTCSWNANGTTTYGFVGTDSAHTVRAFLKEDSSGNVNGAVVTQTNTASGGDNDNDDDSGQGGFGLHMGGFSLGAHVNFGHRR